MTGLEKMISQITDEASGQAQQQIADARAEAEKIERDADAEARNIEAEISRQSETDIAVYLERVQSSSDLKRRTAILKAKQEVITEVLEQAYEALNNLGDEEYFNLIRKMMEKFATDEDGEVYFSEADLKRLPEGFEQEIAEAAKTKGGTLRLSRESKNIENGFILVYGGIEENCTFRALFSTQRDVLQDRVHQEIFA